VRELALFAGAGGGVLGGALLGWRTVCAVELDAYCRRVLLARQRDGMLPRFPVWDDVTTFDGKPWRGHVDVISGGFPCQDISCAGKGAGITGERSGLWSEFARIIREVGPRYVFVENSPMLTSRGLGVVLGGLAQMGFDARWGVLGGFSVGAPTVGERLWLAAAATNGGDGQARVGVHAEHDRAREIQQTVYRNRATAEWWGVDPPRGDGRMDTGLASRVDRLRALGNGQVPAVAALAWRTLGGGP